MKKTLKVFLINVLGLSMIIGGCKKEHNDSSTSITSNTNISSNTTSNLSTIVSTSPSLSSLKIVQISLNYTDNIKYEYTLGEELDLDNVTINVVYESQDIQRVNVTLEMVKLIDTSINQETTMNSAGYKMVIINYEGYETSYLIEVKDLNAPFDKIDPLVSFDFEAGTTFTLGSSIVPSVTLIPSDLDYKISYSSEESGYNSEKYPDIPGTYSMVVNYKGNDKYNSINVWRWFKLVGEKETPTITFNYTAGQTFILGAEERPTVTVSEGADYVITYSSDTTGYNSEEFPKEAGIYSLVVTIKENDKYCSLKRWLWFRLISNEKEIAIITFNYNAGDTFSLSSDVRPTVTVSEGADYVITYSSDTTGYNSNEYPTVAGTYSLVVTVKENDKYAANTEWRWFKLVD